MGGARERVGKWEKSVEQRGGIGRRSKEEKEVKEWKRRIGKQVKKEEKEGAENLYLSDGGIKENANQLRQGVGWVW